jgi:hypothetical protein
MVKFRERLAVNKQGSQKFQVERFSFKNSDEVEGKDKYGFEISNNIPSLKDFDVEMDINSAWETIRENIKISAKEFRLLWTEET